MSKTEFTPGPWLAEIGSADWGMPRSHGIYQASAKRECGSEICTLIDEQPYCLGAKRRTVERAKAQVANAHLIAAAPELYAALERCEEMVSTDCGPPNWDWIRSILAKARGEK